MNAKTCLLLPITLALFACASVPVQPLMRPAADQQGEVVVYRESAFAAGAVGLAVGVDGKPVAVLENTEKVRLLLPAGPHSLYVQARSANPTQVTVQVAPGATVCLRTGANSNTYLKIIVPMTLITSGYNFHLDPVRCPSQEELATYKDIPVSYQ